MKYYTEIIPVTLAEKLREKGMPIDIDCDTFDSGTEYQKEEWWCNNTYAEVFDWLMGEGLSTEVYGRGAGYDFVICKECDDATRGTRKSKPNYDGPNDGGCWDSWHGAANAAIEMALKLIKEN